MPTLRQMIDNRVIYSAGIAPPVAPPPGNAMPMGNSKPPKNANQSKQAGGKTTKGTTPGSPIATHIANHMQNPLGATQDAFGKLTNAKLQYDQAREETQRNLAPVQGVIDHLSQIHGIMPGMPAGQTPTPGMTPAQQPGQTGLDQNGMPMQQPGQDPNNPGENDDPDMDPMTGNPANMGQTVGKMNQNRPSMAGHQPGVSPGPSENVRPGKMGMPQPGGMPQNNKQAKPPKGAGSLPGAKGPGDPKVANKTNKAQGNSSRQVKISVAAATSCNSNVPLVVGSKVDRYFGLATLKAGGPGSGRKKETFNVATQNGWKLRGGHTYSKTGSEQLVHPSHTGQVLNIHEDGKWTHDGQPGGREAGYNASYLQSHLNDFAKRLEASGTSSGAKKNWSTRNKGHLSKKEKQEHYKTMDAVMMPGAGAPGAGMRSPANIGMRPGGGRSGPPISGPRMFAKKKIKAGPAQLSDKVSDSGAELAYNPTGSTPKLNACAKCGKMHSKGMECSMYAGGPGSGRRPSGNNKMMIKQDVFKKGPEISHLIGKRFTDSEGTKWELTGHNDFNVPYFSKISDRSGQAKQQQFTHAEGKERVAAWLQGKKYATDKGMYASREIRRSL